MNSLIFSMLVIVVAAFHLAMGRCMKRVGEQADKLKAIFCACWCIDAVFAVCGTVLSFVLYRYIFYPYLNVRNVILILAYLLVTLLFIWVTPSGISLLSFRKLPGKEEILMAEYRLNDTLGMVRNCFMVLLFLLPVLFAGIQHSEWLTYLASWEEAKICGGFCFVAFVIIVPISLRQAIFWLRNLGDADSETEEKILREYDMRMQYRRRNLFLH